MSNPLPTDARTSSTQPAAQAADVRAPLDPLIKRRSFHRQSRYADIPGRRGLRSLFREWAACCKHDLKRAHGTDQVVGMDEFGGGGVVTRKLCVQRGATLALCSFHQLSPQVRVGRDLRDVPPLYQRPHILTRPTDDDRRLSTSVNVIDGAGSGIKKPPQREIIIGLGESVQVMRHAAALVLTWNTRADVKPAIDLPTVRVDDLAIYLPREPDGNSRLPDRSRPHDGKDDRLGHWSTRNMGAASGFNRPASSCGISTHAPP